MQPWWQEQKVQSSNNQAAAAKEPAAHTGGGTWSRDTLGGENWGGGNLVTSEILKSSADSAARSGGLRVRRVPIGCLDGTWHSSPSESDSEMRMTISASACDAEGLELWGRILALGKDLRGRVVSLAGPPPPRRMP